MSIVNRFDNANEYSKTYDETKMTHEMATLDYLNKYGSITPLEALTAFNSFRLAAHICTLRKKGYPITKVMNKGKRRYAIYSLEREGVEQNG